MRLGEQLHCLLTLADDVPGVWVAWCPQLDICTQGDHIDHAAAMLEEACTMAIEDCLSIWRSDLFGSGSPKKVVHPLRLGKDAAEDEGWPTYQKILETQRGTEGYEDWFSLQELSDNRDGIVLLDGDFNVRTRSGILKVEVRFNDYAYVASERFAVEYVRGDVCRRTFSIRKSTPPEDRQGMIDEQSKLLARDVRRRDQGDSKVRPKTREEKRAELISYDEKSWRSSGRASFGYKHMLELDDLYPEVGIFGPQCISAEVGAGWRDLLVPCLEVLKRHGCKAGQIKQKFCGLRFYWDYPDHIEKARAEWREQIRGMKLDDPNRPRVPLEDESDAIDVEVGPVIARAEALSFRTCEDCGADLGEGRGEKSGRNQCEACDALDRGAARR
jgi:hypothetical protein